MPANYVLLATQTVGNGGAASVSFANIPQTGYTDLKVVISARTNRTSAAVDEVLPRFNGSSTGYSYKYLWGDGSSASSGGSSSDTSIYGATISDDNNTANTFGNFEMYVPNFASSNYKSVTIDSVGETNGTTTIASLVAGIWSNSASITSIAFTPRIGSAFVAGSTFYLYGLAQVGTTPVTAPFASGGDVIANDGTYWYHAFKTTGAFVPAKALTADILVVAGGGGGGHWTGGGAGAGGLLAFNSQALTASSYTCTVGAGGAGGTYATALGTSGVNSQFGSLTASVGGGAGGGFNGTYFSGLSGGSGGGNTSQSVGGAAGTSGQGNAGGAGIGAPNYNGGGGGGANSVGGAAGSSGGVGGGGLNTYSSWATATATGVSGYYAGGGGGGANNSTGGAGGNGGGGNGASNNSTPGVSGTANTGGGGGGGGWSPSAGSDGGKGGSGIIIIRYAMV